MACGSCSTAKDGKPGGCSGSCSGGCNRMNTFDWLSDLEIEDAGDFDLVEVNFKNGARKDFFHNPRHTQTGTGDWVLVEAPGGGYDVGFISLSGDLVRMQTKKKKISLDQLFLNVIRQANERDREKMEEARSMEKATMVKARAIARTLDLDMKIGDVEFQGDGRKATFFYTADGRVDFRELIRLYAKEFKVKVEMRQIGARQESARIGGIGSCGRELCCSTWLSDFKSVSTIAARYQNLAINQSKLSGACGRLKCCLNYELDTYLDALESFPDHADRLQTMTGTAVLIKTDVFKGVMTYVMDTGTEKGKFYSLGISEVKTVQLMNKQGEKPADFKALQVQPAIFKKDDEPEVAYEDVIGAVELRDDKRKKSANNNGQKNKKRPDDRGPRSDRGDGKPAQPNQPGAQSGPKQDKPGQHNPQNQQNPRPPRQDNRDQKPRPPRPDRPTQSNYPLNFDVIPPASVKPDKGNNPNQNQNPNQNPQRPAGQEHLNHRHRDRRGPHPDQKKRPNQPRPNGQNDQKERPGPPPDPKP